jgi:pimeloyl-ACP methyl ester carboxylesterase
MAGLLCAVTSCDSTGTDSAPSDSEGGSPDGSVAPPQPDSGSADAAGPDTSSGDAGVDEAAPPTEAGADDAGADGAGQDTPVTGTTYHLTIPKLGNMNGDANYYAWVPDGAAPVRSIIVHQHGCTREYDAPQMVTDLQWLQLAKKWRSVFVAPAQVTAPDCANWFNPDNGTGTAFLQMLDALAAQTSHAEISTVPWAIWGHSGGAMWATAMTGKYPDRVITTVAQACATEISGIPAVLPIPVLHHNGAQDLCYNNQYFTNGRSKGALWGYAINPNPLWVTQPNAFPANVEGHAPHDLRMLAIPWMDVAMTMRLPAAAGTATLRPVDTSNAWLGDLTTFAIANAPAFTGDPLSAVWLPDQTMAEKWKEYMNNGTIVDTTPPPAPRSLNGAFANGTLSLTWDCDADLESGLKTFVVYRDGAVLQKLQYNTTTLFTTETGFQRWNDGDQPAPSPAPDMKVDDSGLDASQTYTYQVSAVNWSDLEGSKSQTLTLDHGMVVPPK